MTAECDDGYSEAPGSSSSDDEETPQLAGRGGV